MSRALLLKTDKQGNQQEIKYYGTGTNTTSSVGIDTCAGGYYMAGNTSEFGAAAADFMVIKLNYNGDTLWVKTYGGPHIERLHGFKTTSDGGLVMVGGTYNVTVSPVNPEAYIVKTDANGDTLWTLTWGGPDIDYAMSVAETPDGGYAVIGTTHVSVFSSIFLLKINSSGVIEWEKKYSSTGGSGSAQGFDLLAMPDSGFVLTGIASTYHPETNLYMWDGYILRTDQNGDTLWTVKFGGGSDDNVSGIILKDNDLMMIGNTASFGNGVYDALLLNISDEGVINWYRTYGGTGSEYTARLIATKDGGFAITGMTDSDCPSCLYFIKTDSLGCIVPGCQYTGIENFENKSDFISLYPNPVQDILNINFKSSFENNFIQVKIYDYTGRCLQTRLLVIEKGSSFYSSSILVQEFPSELYTIIFEIGEQRILKKFIKQ
jgi:hypothetical protein